MWTKAVTGAEWSVFNPTRSWSRRNRAQLYGLNTMAAGKPNVFDMAFRFLLHPIYIIQVGLSVLDVALGLS